MQLELHGEVHRQKKKKKAKQQKTPENLIDLELDCWCGSAQSSPCFQVSMGEIGAV